MVFDHCHPTQAVPIIHLHSTLDQNIPFQGGIGGSGGYNFNSLDSTHQTWINILNCTNPKNIVYQSSSGLFLKSLDCACNTELHYYLTRDGGNDGHTWFENPSSVLDATELLLAFFAQYTNNKCLINNTVDLEILHDIEIFPNPASNYVLIDRKENEDLDFSVYNSQGKLVKWMKIENFPLQLKTEEFTKGEYYFHFSDGRNSKVKKVIIFK
jgi:hypothetical protein